MDSRLTGSCCTWYDLGVSRQRSTGSRAPIRVSGFLCAYPDQLKEVKTLQTHEPRYLTIQEVATRYQLHPETVRRWIIEGRLPAIKLAGGSAWRVREDALVAIEHNTSA